MQLNDDGTALVTITIGIFHVELLATYQYVYKNDPSEIELIDLICTSENPEFSSDFLADLCNYPPSEIMEWLHPAVIARHKEQAA